MSLREFSGLVIEGQPQPRRPGGGSRGEFSGLVIEGQPQHRPGVTYPVLEFSGLVIEGQPQLAFEHRSLLK